MELFSLSSTTSHVFKLGTFINHTLDNALPKRNQSISLTYESFARSQRPLFCTIYSCFVQFISNDVLFHHQHSFPFDNQHQSFVGMNLSIEVNFIGGELKRKLESIPP